MNRLGLTYQSSGFALSRERWPESTPSGDYVVALAGNPNTGKSTVFNALTGLKQHTGNWPGKTVVSARGKYRHRGKEIALVDLPGTYSLLANSTEEQIARDFICFGRPNVTVVVVDATCLERNLNLVLQVMEITSRVVVCLNLIDEARRKKIKIDVPKLAKRLGIPVVPTAARSAEGLEKLKDVIDDTVSGRLLPQPIRVCYPQPIEKDVDTLATDLLRVLPCELNPRWVALRLIDGDESLVSSLVLSLHEHLSILQSLSYGSGGNEFSTLQVSSFHRTFEQSSENAAIRW